MTHGDGIEISLVQPEQLPYVIDQHFRYLAGINATQPYLTPITPAVLIVAIEDTRYSATIAGVETDPGGKCRSLLCQVQAHGPRELFFVLMNEYLGQGEYADHWEGPFVVHITTEEIRRRISYSPFSNLFS